jgi:hypothetical protein
MIRTIITLGVAALIVAVASGCNAGGHTVAAPQGMQTLSSTDTAKVIANAPGHAAWLAKHPNMASQ